MDNRPIGVFDSGLGGLTGVRELRKRLPHEEIIYFGDTGRVPYGSRSPETILQYARQDIAFLLSKDVKCIMAACGTVSSTYPAAEAALLPVPGVTDGLPRMGDLLVIFYISLGCWRAAPVTRLLLRSAQNHLDLETNQTMGHFFENIFHALVGLFAGIAMLDRLGVPVSGLLTGAGVAGLAVSLAAQSTLNSLIAGITLVLERPFGIGDYIVLGDCEGTVEDISFRSTRIRSPDNVAITIENSKITAEYIQNYDRRQSRLWKFTIGLTYDTPRERIEQLTADLTAMLQAQPDVQPDGVTIALDKFNDYSIDLACRVYITKVNLRDFMQVKNTLNLQILDLMQEEGCEFAFPTTTVDLPERK